MSQQKKLQSLQGGGILTDISSERNKYHMCRNVICYPWKTCTLHLMITQIYSLLFLSKSKDVDGVS